MMSLNLSCSPDKREKRIFFLLGPSALLPSMLTTENDTYFLQSPSQDSGGPITCGLSNHSGILLLLASGTHSPWTSVLFSGYPYSESKGHGSKDRDKPEFTAHCCHHSGLLVYPPAGPSPDIGLLPSTPVYTQLT